MLPEWILRDLAAKYCSVVIPLLSNFSGLHRVMSPSELPVTASVPPIPTPLHVKHQRDTRHEGGDCQSPRFLKIVTRFRREQGVFNAWIEVPDIDCLASIGNQSCRMTWIHSKACLPVPLRDYLYKRWIGAFSIDQVPDQHLKKGSWH